MRALSTCDKQNLCNGRGEPQEKKKTFESMNSALYVHIDSELKYLLVHEFLTARLNQLLCNAQAVSGRNCCPLTTSMINYN